MFKATDLADRGEFWPLGLLARVIIVGRNWGSASTNA